MGYQKILNIFLSDHFIDGYILNDLQIVARCARSAALIRASARVRNMVTYYGDICSVMEC